MSLQLSPRVRLWIAGRPIRGGSLRVGDSAAQLNSSLCVIGGALGTEGARTLAVDPVKRAINGAYAFCEEQQALLDEGLITEEQWFANQEQYFADLYLSTDNPRMQSGHGGDEARYRYTQEMILGQSMEMATSSTSDVQTAY